jgi:hypothetical protein
MDRTYDEQWYREWIFHTRESAEEALRLANAAWNDTEYTPKGAVVTVELEHGMIVGVNTPEAVHGYAVMNENGEYMVTTEDPTWVCVA